ncbi:hypothetical protein [Nonomuraea sp. NPDC049725]|uniref:hypothetical protein n=1 Tax=Nonomuraea sp. NPDC049725 TaxID=3154508 RepID=UPI0034174484
MRRAIRAAAVAVALLATAAACGQGGGQGGGQGAEGAAARRHLFVVAGGELVTGPDRVEARTGDTVELVVTSDAADELHVHGYDREAELVPGRASTLSLVADIPGVFEVELHRGGLVLTRLRVSP